MSGRDQRHGFWVLFKGVFLFIVTFFVLFLSDRGDRDGLDWVQAMAVVWGAWWCSYHLAEMRYRTK